MSATRVRMRCSHVTIKGNKCKNKSNVHSQYCHVHQPVVCPICIESIAKEDSKNLKCSHTFHNDCITKWFVESSICPVCRDDMSHEPLIQFKFQVENKMRNIYRDAIESLEEEIETWRSRRPVIS